MNPALLVAFFVVGLPFGAFLIGYGIKNLLSYNDDNSILSSEPQIYEDEIRDPRSQLVLTIIFGFAPIIVGMIAIACPFGLWYLDYH